MIIVASILLTVGAASADTMDLVVDKYTINDNNPNGVPDCENYTVRLTYESNEMTVVIIEPTVIDQPDAFLLNIGMMIGSNPVQNVTLLDDTEMQFTIGGSNFATLGDFDTNITFSQKKIDNTNVIPKPRAYKIIFANNIAFSSANAEGFLAAVHVGGLTSDYTADGETSVKIGNGECGGGTGTGTDIPEFPTIALPIAAILGLAFFFQRRKE
jgi:hypothetical protein